MNTKTLTLLGKNIKVDIDHIATGLKEICPNIYIGYGMFEAEQMQFTEKAIRNKIAANFDEFTSELFATSINQFVSDCMHEITVKLF